LLIKAKQQHGKNENKNTDLFINCMDFVVVRTKIKKKSFFMLCLGLGMNRLVNYDQISWKVNKFLGRELFENSQHFVFISSETIL
jgi:hypothetical protein